MALVKKLERVEKQRNSVHEEVECTYTIFTNSAGDKYFQIDTYGSNNREIRGKVSQSIQLNKDSAIELLEIITKEFNS